ncbi:MAG: hypothetical protein ACRD2Q_08180 [Terriglobales bacterium]
MEPTTIEIMRALAILLATMVMFDGLDTIEALERPQTDSAAQ